MSPEPIWTVALMAGDDMPFATASPTLPNGVRMVAKFAFDNEWLAQTLVTFLTHISARTRRGDWVIGEHIAIVRLLYALAIPGSVAGDAPHKELT